MPGSALGGLASGFWDNIDAQRQENQRLADQRAQSERSILTTLMNSDDPKVRSYAVAGMLDAASPRRKLKGIGGFLGDYERNPEIQQIHDYLNTPQTTEVPGLPSKSIAPNVASSAPAPVLPNAPGGSAALPSTSPVTGGPVGQPPPAPTVNGVASNPAQASVQHPVSAPQSMAGAPPPTMGSAFTVGHPPPAVGRTDTHYPQAFEDPAVRLREDTIAKQQAEVEGRVAGYVAAGGTREQALAIERARIRGASGASFQGVTDGAMLPEGMPDAYGRPVVKGQNYRMVNGQAYPVNASAISRPFKVLQMPDGSPGLYRLNPDGSKEFVGAVPKGMTVVHVTHEDGSEEMLQVPKEFQAPTPGAAGGFPDAAGTIAAPGAAPTPAGAPAASPVAAGGPPAAAPATPAAIQTKPATFKPVTVKTADGKIMPALQRHDGSFVDAKDKTTVLAGAAEVPNSAMLEKPLSADAKKTLESVDAILPMMQRVTAAMDEAKLGLDPNEGYIKQGMQVLHGMGQQAEYSMGLDPGDPVYRELLPLIANLKVMATSPYLHGVRNMQYIQQIQSHLPSVTDSPALIRSKLAQMEPTLKSLVNAVHETEGNGPPTPGAAGAGGAQQQDPRIGKWASELDGNGKPTGRRGVARGIDAAGNPIMDFNAVEPGKP